MLWRGARAGADLRSILDERAVTDPVQAILDGPLALIHAASSAGLAWSAKRLVTAYTVSARVHFCS